MRNERLAGLIPLTLALCLAVGTADGSVSGASGESRGHPPSGSATDVQGDRATPPVPEPADETGSRDLQATHTLRIPGSVLRPVDSDATYSSSGSGGCVYATASPNSMFNTFVNLPHGATLLQLRFYFYDTSGSDSFVLLTELDYQGDVSTEWRLDSFGDTGPGLTTFSGINHVVDTTTYSYVVRWRPVATGSAMQACGFRLWYFDPNIFANGFESGDTAAWSATVQ